MSVPQFELDTKFKKEKEDLFTIKLDVDNIPEVLPYPIICLCNQLAYNKHVNCKMGTKVKWFLIIERCQSFAGEKKEIVPNKLG
uniref:Putative ovule protein n=1 Tax=Solanum chacoense TaxID=4108 RepID=A0A0V0HUA5_SOLCH